MYSKQQSSNEREINKFVKLQVENFPHNVMQYYCRQKKDDQRKIVFVFQFAELTHSNFLKRFFSLRKNTIANFNLNLKKKPRSILRQASKTHGTNVSIMKATCATNSLNESTIFPSFKPCHGK